MAGQIVTEYEWRKRAYKPRRRLPTWWGAQCVYNENKRRKRRFSRITRMWMITGAFTAAMIILCVGCPIDETFDSAPVKVEISSQPRSVSSIVYDAPKELLYQSQTFSYSELVRGKWLLLDEEHPLPQNVPPPNTYSIAKYGNGMVPVRSLNVKTGLETIQALQSLFQQLKKAGIGNLYVWKGCTTAAQQELNLIQQARSLMRKQRIEEAVQAAYAICETPGTGELLQEYTVELRLMDQPTVQPDERFFAESAEGQALGQLAWRYGFVRTNPQHPFRWRYVGNAHAMAMTYLDLAFEEYLEWMHQQKTMVLSAGGLPQYLILCQPLQGGYAVFDLPVGCSYEVGLDNLGYAFAVCEL